MSKMDEINKRILENTNEHLLLHPDIKAILKSIEGLETLKTQLQETRDNSANIIDLEASIDIIEMLVDIETSIKELEQQIFIENKK
jgi:hypothetical protein